MLESGIAWEGGDQGVCPLVTRRTIETPLQRTPLLLFLDNVPDPINSILIIFGSSCMWHTVCRRCGPDLWGLWGNILQDEHRNEFSNWQIFWISGWNVFCFYHAPYNQTLSLDQSWWKANESGYHYKLGFVYHKCMYTFPSLAFDSIPLFTPKYEV